MVREELVDRLVCAKYIFETGNVVLERGGPYSAGLAVLAFQDALELVLRTIAEHLHAQVKDNAAFNQLLDEIDKVAPGKLTHRSALNQLNRARVSFKHLGMLPRDEEVPKFRRDLEGFFPNAVSAFMGLDFEGLSLSSLITHRRTRNWVRKAEAHLSAGEYPDCVAACATAVSLFQSYRRRWDEDLTRPRLAVRMDMDSVRVIGDLVSEVQDQLGNIYSRLDLIGNGIPYNDYKRFDDMTPTVHFTMDGTEHMNLFRSEYTSQEAQFCVAFARNLILKLQDKYRHHPFAPKPGTRRYRTLHPTSIIVCPRADREPEVIEVVGVGTELTNYGTRSDRPGHIAIYYQGDCAYVAADSVVQVAENDSTLPNE